MRESKTLIRTDGLSKHFTIKKAKRIGRSPREILKAVNDVSFDMAAGQTFGLVGESGSGKSTLGRCICGLYDLTAGHVWFDGTDIGGLPPKQLLPFRKRMQMIFQDPYSSLNPTMTVLDIIGEPIGIHGLAADGKERKEMVCGLLEKVGLTAGDLYRYPGEFSGGQRQRISIARSVSVRPELIICDEPISSLDVSIQAQVVNLLEDLRSEYGLTYLFIAHDLSMVRHISDRVGVMYAGRLMELGDSEEIYEHSCHPYTKALLSAIPDPDPRTPWNCVELNNKDPSESSDAGGCPFSNRCPGAGTVCFEEVPAFREVADGHLSACHFFDQL